MKILIAEEDQTARESLASLAAHWGHEVEAVGDGDAAWRALETRPAPQLAILDWMMGGVDGVEICRRCRGPGMPYVYIILMVPSGEADVVRAIEGGADDYLTKPIDTHELRMRVRTGLRVAELQAEVAATQATLRVQATHDALTGVFNRGTILEMLHLEVARSQRFQSPVSLAMVGIDAFHGLSREHGMVVSDELLVEVAHRLKDGLRAYDGIGRHGAENFLIVLPGCGGPAAMQVAERLRCAALAPAFATSAGDLQLTLSVGVSTSRDGDTALTLVRAADEALLRVRNGNTVCWGQSRAV